MASDYIDRSLTLTYPAQNGPFEYLDRARSLRCSQQVTSVASRLNTTVVVDDNLLDR